MNHAEQKQWQKEAVCVLLCAIPKLVVLKTKSVVVFLIPTPYSFSLHILGIKVFSSLPFSAVLLENKRIMFKKY